MYMFCCTVWRWLLNRPGTGTSTSSIFHRVSCNLDIFVSFHFSIELASTVSNFICAWNSTFYIDLFRHGSSSFPGSQVILLNRTILIKCSLFLKIQIWDNRPTQFFIIEKNFIKCSIFNCKLKAVPCSSRILEYDRKESSVTRSVSCKSEDLTNFIVMKYEINVVVLDKKNNGSMSKNYLLRQKAAFCYSDVCQINARNTRYVFLNPGSVFRTSKNRSRIVPKSRRSKLQLCCT